MTKELLISGFEELSSKIKNLQRLADKSKGELLTKKVILELAETVSRAWFEQMKPKFESGFKIDLEIIKKYDVLFEKLLQFSKSRAVRKKSFLAVLSILNRDLKRDLVLPVIKSNGASNKFLNLESKFINLTDSEKSYFKEAISCANSGFLRAAVVLGWCATIDRIQQVIEKLGLEEFNKKSIEMAELKEGRYKRFGKKFAVKSITELQVIFDNDLLWVLEYWGLIDSNQHDRLSLCFTMRNNCAHPGEAPMTEENVLSFFSDLDKIIFSNPKFSLVN